MAELSERKHARMYFDIAWRRRMLVWRLFSEELERRKKTGHVKHTIGYNYASELTIRPATKEIREELAWRYLKQSGVPH